MFNFLFGILLFNSLIPFIVVAGLSLFVSGFFGNLINRTEDDTEPWQVLGVVIPVAFIMGMFAVNWNNGINIGASALVAFLAQIPIWVFAVVAIAYFVFGAVWAKFMWTRFIVTYSRDIERKIKDFVQKYNLPANFVETLDDETTSFPLNLLYSTTGGILKNYIENARIHRYNSNLVNSFTDWITAVTPQVSSHKVEIVFWIAAWPFSVLNFAFFNMVFDAAREIFYRLRDNFQAQSDERMKTFIKG